MRALEKNAVALNLLCFFRMNVQEIHDRAIDAAGRYRRAESELIEILQLAEQHRVFLAKGHSSLFLYVVRELGLSESVAYNLISVARKAREVPELKIEIAKGAITLSNARKIVPVLRKENKALWLTKARELSHRQLEKEVVKIRPQLATPERATYVTPSRVRLELGLSEKDMLKLRRVQDLFCQLRRHPVTLEEVLVALTDDFLKRHDPVARAKRQQVKTGLREIEADSSNKSNRVIEPDAGTFESEQETRSSRNPSDPVKPVALQARTPDARAECGTRAEGGMRIEGVKVKTRKIHVREPIPTRVLHQINLRDGGRCQYANPGGEKCNQTRWTEIHHLKPVSKGGMNTVENLRTLCSTHHQWIHLQAKH